MPDLKQRHAKRFKSISFIVLCAVWSVALQGCLQSSGDSPSDSDMVNAAGYMAPVIVDDRPKNVSVS